MKKIPALLLIASLAANAMWLVTRVSQSPSAVAAPAAGTRSGSAPSQGEGAKKSADSTAAASGVEAAQIAKAWEKVQGGDIDTLADRLRDAGFPSSIVKAIVSAQRKALLAQPDETRSWKSLKREFGDLSNDKLAQMRDITRDYNELRKQIHQEANGVLLPEDREKLALLEKEQRADLARVLAPGELENYELRTSDTAKNLRSMLGGFRPSEEEFRSIFRAVRAAEDQYGSLTAAAANPGQVRLIQAAALENARAALSGDRFADLNQAIDPAYQQVNRLVARLDLPNSAAVEVVAVRQEIQNRANTIRSNRTLSPAQRNAELSGLAQEASAKISTVLGGTRGLEAYKNYGGQWIQNLVPKPKPAPSLPRGG